MKRCWWCLIKLKVFVEDSEMWLLRNLKLRAHSACECRCGPDVHPEPLCLVGGEEQVMFRALRRFIITVSHEACLVSSG